MVYIQLQKSNITGKRYTAVFYDENRKKIKSTSFGYDKGSTFLGHGDTKNKAYI